ncbi:hypothetical protein PtA15_15A302 [Puccinia triticina]|uniref:Uncharacterized protein n=1 Tax=Puccinia triticina TaxID=208348 RepID=A0ABY7D108_9BASI|nr:uncharacterized protein PtA15_7A158 [Puccinia triticina]XP_053026480.1 uncharacterized protein PtA15_13A325 [Puccinia triticina]XP_053027060.1 uncharacterized protein PtA15_14A389 [Puccinia triticina]XP_053027464.1 uncharacterized protein PtA15_15A302 [Puccinia triticina]WAQ86432.1 hypothetical protein PtA15_7A158 [Puccinia triticina]WAQ90925.1 hypothetical protein PtA15_13A325 [Puccinia triticina]WAQ91505.1 hypothetical protein PtA15_14A389 [Puccinia triticina]WAQ91909.1 hypothetical pro
MTWWVPTPNLGGQAGSRERKWNLPGSGPKERPWVCSTLVELLALLEHLLRHQQIWLSQWERLQ